jgi:hypothetical protein
VTKDQSLQMLGTLFLADPETGTDLVLCSPLVHDGNGWSRFLVQNTETGQRHEVKFKIREI